MAFEVEYFTIDSTTSTNRKVDLSGTPIVEDNVAMDLIGGTAQALTGDFGVDGTTVKWDSTDFALYSQITSGDRIRVIYDRS